MIVAALVALLLLGAGAAPVSAPISGVLQSEPLRQATTPKLPGWLAGCWERRTPGRLVEEHWMAPSGGIMLGMGRTSLVEPDSLVEFEQTRIERERFHLVFTATPSQQAPASFSSIQLTDYLVIFENKSHDFPQRVGYRLLPDGSLNAWIEGARDGRTRHIDFPYQRVPCPGGPK